MKTVVYDTRDERRFQGQLTGRDGTLLPENPNKSKRYGYVDNRDTQTVVDIREVTITVEEHDYADGVPQTLDPNNYWFYGQRVYEFYVRSITLKYKRKNDESDRWVLESFFVGGPNRRKDGSEGEKPQSLRYPTQSLTPTGEHWTEAEITADAGHHLYKRQRERVGTAKVEWRTDDLPAWLVEIERKSNPSTGTAFRYGDVHQFGAFSSSSDQVVAQ